MILAAAVEAAAELAISNADATAIAPWTAEAPGHGVGLGQVNVRLGTDRRREAVPDDPPVAKAHIPRNNRHRRNRLISRLPIKLHMLILLPHTLTMHRMAPLGLTSLPHLHSTPVGHLPHPHLVRASTLQLFLLLSLDLLCLYLPVSPCLLGSITSLLPILGGNMAPGGLLEAETGDRRFLYLYQPRYEIQNVLLQAEMTK